ncbi:MAG: extracellular solute-binding protein [Lachnospiraceae bacterium]|nr:extracellular solute-binding protein [Lachnospiraceae bacterium]
MTGALLCGSLTGCAGGAGSGAGRENGSAVENGRENGREKERAAENGSAEEDGKETVSVALWGGQLLEGYTGYLQEQFPEVEFEFYLASNTTDYYRFCQEKGKLPDILTVRRFSLNDVKNLKDELMDLSDTDLANSFYQSYLRSYTYDDGTVNWLPACAEVDSLIINKTLFEQYEIPVPTDYESFLSACAAFEEHGIQGFMTDYARDYTCLELLQGWSIEQLMSMDGRLWRQEYESGMASQLSETVWMPVFEKMEDFIKHMNLTEADNETEPGEVNERFQAGRVAMYRGTGADVLAYRESGEALLMPYFGKTPEDNWYLTYPSFQAAAKEQETPERRKLILEIMSVMLGEGGLKHITTGQNMVAYNKGVQLELLPELQNLSPAIKDNRLYIRLASNDMFSISREVVQGMISGQLPDARAAYEEFNRLLILEKEEEKETVLIETGYPYTFYSDGGNPAASAIINTVREEAGMELMLCQASDISGDIVAGMYREHDLNYLMRGENIKIYRTEMTGAEMEQFITHTLEQEHSRSSVVNDSTLYVSSGFEMEIFKTEEGYQLGQLTIQGEPVKAEQTYSFGVISSVYHFAEPIFEKMGITAFDFHENTANELFIRRLTGGGQLSEPAAYMYLKKR